MLNVALALLFVFATGYTVGVVVTRLASRRREQRRLRRLMMPGMPPMFLRAPRAPQAVRREAAHG